MSIWPLHPTSVAPSLRPMSGTQRPDVVWRSMIGLRQCEGMYADMPALFIAHRDATCGLAILMVALEGQSSPLCEWAARFVLDRDLDEEARRFLIEIYPEWVRPGSPELPDLTPSSALGGP